MNFEKIIVASTPEQQFENKEKLDFYGGLVEVVDVKPPQAKSEVPVIMASGWGGTPEMYKRNILTLAETGRRAISIDAPHGVEHEINSQGAETMPDVELRKIAALINTLEEKGLDKVDVIGHSEGAIYTALAAKLYPEKFRNLILVNPGGMIGEDNPVRLTINFARDSARQAIDSIRNTEMMKSLMTAASELTKSAITNPLKATQEIKAISGTQIHELLKELKEAGIGIVIIHGVDDKVFPMDRVQEIAKADQLDGFVSVKGTHGQLMLEAEKYTKAAESMLTALENKEKHRLNN